MNPPLRVLSISTLYPNPEQPGFGRFVARQFAALAQRGDIDLTVVNPVPRAPWPLRTLIRGSDARGIPLLDASGPFPVYHPRFNHLPRLSAPWNHGLIWRAVLPLARRLHGEKPFDLIDAQFFYPDGPAAAHVARALGLPLVIKARGSDIHYWGTRRLPRARMVAAADQAAGVLAVSEALKADMNALGMEAAKIAVHYTGLDHALFHPRPRAKARLAVAAWDSQPIPADGPLLASIGNLVPLKGHAIAIEALAQLPGARLAIAGSGPELAALQRLTAQLDLTGRVHFLGALGPEDIAVLLCAAEAMVLPSEREGLANVWIEALASGTPLVITDVGGAREVVTTASAGRLAPRTPEGIAFALRDILDHPCPQAEVAANAARFSWEANAEALAAVYRRAAGEGPSRASRS